MKEAQRAALLCSVAPAVTPTAGAAWGSEQPLLSGSGDAESRPEAVIEHLVRRQGQPRGAQLHAMHLNDWEGWSLDPPLPRLHLRVVRVGENISCRRSLPT